MYSLGTLNVFTLLCNHQSPEHFVYSCDYFFSFVGSLAITSCIILLVSSEVIAYTIQLIVVLLKYFM